MIYLCILTFFFCFFFLVLNPTIAKECDTPVYDIQCKDTKDCVPICDERFPGPVFPKSCMGGGSVCICAYNC